MQDIGWSCKQFSQLGNHELYALIKFRIDIFVVEQNCAYAELDDKDRDANAWHVLAQRGSALLAYARLLPPGLSYADCSIGRFAVHADVRRRGLGSQLLQQCIKQATQLWPRHGITLGAQQHLTGFYQQHGFEPVSAVYMEDGIPHIDMHRTATPA